VTSDELSLLLPFPVPERCAILYGRIILWSRPMEIRNAAGAGEHCSLGDRS
jgi:hypothetical protein